ncbi:MAG: flagellar hook-basal body complex protein FliE [Chitinivibrionales bacterium]|nr:flagellar hook-basal body complex protein FliE [Chitinivibrionales bacterium]
MAQINPIGPVDDGQKAGRASRLHAKDKNAPTFKDTLKGVMKDVNDMQVKADKSIEKMVAGEITDVHQVMSAVEEANVAFNMMMEIRNKVMDAYQEVMRMRL